MVIILEFYSVQTDPDDPGVLVLSLLAGIADEMKQALLVNPHDLDGVATATAANMPRCERIERWPAMMQYCTSTPSTTGGTPISKRWKAVEPPHPIIAGSVRRKAWPGRKPRPPPHFQSRNRAACAGVGK